MLPFSMAFLIFNFSDFSSFSHFLARRWSDLDVNFSSMIWFKSFSVVKRERVKLGDELEKREILKFSEKMGLLSELYG